MVWLLGGYMWLYIHRPFEVWPALGAVQLERGYMLVMILVWLVSPGKGLALNRFHLAQGFFGFTLLAAWMTSPYAGHFGPYEIIDNYVKVAVFYGLVVTSVRDERSLRLLVLLYLAAVGLYMSHSFWEFLHGRYQWRMGTRRMIGVDVSFCDPNAFASTLLYSLPMTLPFWSEKPRRLPRPLLLGFVFLVIVCILLTGSRAGFAGLCLLGLVLLVLSSRRKLQAFFLAGVAGVAGLLILSVALPEDLQNRYMTLVDSSRGPQNAQTSAEGRLDGFLWGLYVWQQSPLFGHGPGSFGYSTGRGGQAHNLYGQVLAETGLAGAVALLLVVLCFWGNWRQTRRFAALGICAPQGDFTYAVSRAVTLNVFLLLVMGWSGHNLYRYNWQWLAAFAAIALHCLHARVSAVQEMPPQTHLGVWPAYS